MKRTSLILAAAGTLTAAALVGTALAVGGDDPTPGASAPPTVATSPADGATSTAPKATPSTSAPVTWQRAVEIARSAVGGGTLDEVELEEEHGTTVWSVRILKDGIRHRVDVDRATGRITRTEQTGTADRHGDDDDDHGGRHSGSDDTDDDHGDDHGGHHSGTDDTDDDHGGHHSGSDDG